MNAQEIRAFIDLQTHPTMHLPYPIFKKGFTYFDSLKPPKESYKHLLSNVHFANYNQDNSGARIIVTGALCREVIFSRRKAKKLILKQLAYINDFAKNNSEYFAVAKSPEEARILVNTTDKTIIIHSIEGAKMLVNSQKDADFWAKQGIAFMTLVHLVDDEFGAAATQPRIDTKVINYKHSFKKVFLKKKRRGLTDKGRNAIQWLANAGIMTDITHMADSTREDALNYMETNNITPIVTHDLFKPIQNQPRGITKKDILRIYKMGGFMSLPISGGSTEAYNPMQPYKKELDSLTESGCHCHGSVDSYKYTYQSVMNFVKQNAGELNGTPKKSFEDLTEMEKVSLSIGFQSDFNGWVNHSRPRYGDEGCFETQADGTYEAIELQGMPHAGLLPSQWKYMENNAVDLEPIKRNSEHFLQIWQRFIDLRIK